MGGVTYTVVLAKALLDGYTDLIKTLKDNEELLEAWRTKVPGVEPTDSDLRAFALGVEFGTRGKRVYFDERNSARDAWRRRVKQCETLEAEVQRLRDALEQIEREANQPYIQRIAAAALKVGE